MSYGLILLFIFLIIFVPVKLKIKVDNYFEIYLVVFYIFKIKLNYLVLFNKFITQKYFNTVSVSEIIENTQKLIESRFIILDILKNSIIKKLHVDITLPVENLLFEPYLLTFLEATKANSLLWLDTTFKNMYNTKINFYESSQNLDFDVKTECIIVTRLANILWIGIKYFNKLPILFKRVT